MDEREMVLLFLGIIIAFAITYFSNRANHGNTLKKYNKMTKKTIAKITNIEEQVYHYLDTAPHSETLKPKKEYHYYASYEFTVDNQVYHGVGQISGLGKKKKTKIFYNPQNPAENVSAYNKSHANGKVIIIAGIITLTIIFGLPLLVLSLIRK